MPNPSEKRKNKRYVRTPSGKVVVRYFKGKSAKHTCAICDSILAGVPHAKKASEVRAMPKSQRRPEVPFGGILCSKCRRAVFEEASRVSMGKDIGKVSLAVKPYVEQALNRLRVAEAKQ
jgi:large subunit ribosomal protein L34e